MILRRCRTGVLVVCGLAYGGGLPSPASGSGQEGPVELMPERSAVPDSADPVMKPTRHAVRFAPEMADAVAGYLIECEIGRNIVLRREQKARLTEVIARRLRETGEEWREKGVGAAESLIANVARDFLLETPLDAATARVTGERMKPAVALATEFWRRLPEDTASVLDTDQQSQMVEMSEAVQRFLSRLDARLDRWARGEVIADEKLLRHIFAEELPTADNRSSMLRQAEENARSNVRWTGPKQFASFLSDCIRAFAFDDAQRRAGASLQREYTERALGIMNGEWREAVLRVQVKSTLLWMICDMELRPAMFLVDEEHRALTEPLDRLAREYRRRVIMLVTRAQLERFMEQMRQVGREHGMTADEIEPMTRLFPQSQPEAD